VSDTVLVRSPDFLGKELEESGGSIDAVEDEGKGRVCRGQGHAYPPAGEETPIFCAPLDRIDKVNHRG
jgi:hypothetical protein